MMKKIVAFISKFGQEFSIHNQPDTYIAFDGIIVSGRQTNEAPIKYLLQRDSEIGEVIAICTSDVTKPDETFNVSAFDYLRKEIPNVRFVPIGFNYEHKTFEQEPLPEILSRITPEDTIYLETSGGFRNISSYLLLLPRILLYQGTKMGLAVYSNFQAKRIENVTDTYREFDLINGLNEFNMFGSTSSLERYYKTDSRPPQEIERLVDEMRRLSECVTLCRTGKIDNRIKKVEEALTAAENAENIDPVMRILLPIFGQKFKSLSTTPAQIRWCAENNLIQQALTIYTDRLPRYLMEGVGLIELPVNYFENTLNKYIEREDAKAHANGTERSDEDRKLDEVLAYKSKDKYNYALNDGFFSISLAAHRATYKADDYAVKTMENFDSIVVTNWQTNRFRLTTCMRSPDNSSLVKRVLNDYLYAYILRNQFNHVNEELLPQKKKVDYLDRLDIAEYKTDIDKLSAEEIKVFLISAMNTLEQTLSKIR